MQYIVQYLLWGVGILFLGLVLEAASVIIHRDVARIQRLVKRHDALVHAGYITFDGHLPLPGLPRWLRAVLYVLVWPAITLQQIVAFARGTTFILEIVERHERTLDAIEAAHAHDVPAAP